MGGIPMKGSPDNIRDLKESETYFDYYSESRGVEQGTLRNTNTAWNHIQSFLNERDLEFEEVGEREALDFCDFLKQRDSLEEKSAEMYVYQLSRMVQWFKRRGVFDYDPFALALEENPFKYDSETIKREVLLEELRVGIDSIRNPLVLTLVVLLLKTGMRLSEAANLDYRDIHLDHSIAERMDTPRAQVADKPDSLYIDSSISEGQFHNGELRKNGNKPNSYRVIPIDDELKATLVWWIGMTLRSPSPANPLLVKNNRGMGARYEAYRLRDIFSEWANQNGWHRGSGGGQYQLNVTPHWCRHWFSTMLRKRIDSDEIEIGTVDNYVNGLRGDSEGNVLEIYTHDWGDNKWMRDAYIDNVPKLFR
jgi:integrase